MEEICLGVYVTNKETGFAYVFIWTRLRLSSDNYEDTRQEYIFSSFCFLKKEYRYPPPSAPLANVGEAFTDKPFLSFYKHLIIPHLCITDLFIYFALLFLYNIIGK